MEEVPSEILDPKNAISCPTTQAFSIIIIILPFSKSFKVNWKFCVIIVVRKTSLQGESAKAGWIVQEQF